MLFYFDSLYTQNKQKNLFLNRNKFKNRKNELLIEEKVKTLEYLNVSEEAGCLARQNVREFFANGHFQDLFNMDETASFTLLTLTMIIKKKKNTIKLYVW